MHPWDFKKIRMIPSPRTTVANGTTVSAGTYGSAASAVWQGIVDTKGWDYAIIAIHKQTGTAMKASWRIYHQSGAATLTASATALTSCVQSGVTVSTATSLYRIDLKALNLKRYLNARAVLSTTSGNIEIDCFLFRGESYPVSNATTTRNITAA